jgi:hypothetical protein
MRDGVDVGRHLHGWVPPSSAVVTTTLLLCCLPLACLASSAPFPPLVVSSASRSPPPAPSAPPPLVMFHRLPVARKHCHHLIPASSFSSLEFRWLGGGKKHHHLPPHNSANRPTHQMRGVIQKLLAMGINMIENIQETKNILFGSLVGSGIKK